MIRLLIVERSEALRIGLRMIFSLNPILEITAETDEAGNALRLAYDCQPDIVLLDIDIEEGNGLLQSLVAQHPKSPIIVLTIRPHKTDHEAVLGLGAFACIEKRASPQDLLNAIDDASSAALAVRSAGAKPPPAPPVSTNKPADENANGTKKAREEAPPEINARRENKPPFEPPQTLKSWA